LPTYVALSGGIGGAKLVLGLDQVLDDGQLHVIANTGDDFEHLGLTICPDIDTLMYTLAGVANPELGWGLAGESWDFMDALAALGGPAWFQLGDRDLATHIRRRAALAAGQTLSEATAELCAALGVRTSIAPMSDQQVRTLLETSAGQLEFQEYFVRRQAQPEVRSIRYQGAAGSHASPRATEWLNTDSLGGIIITPSNPWLSIDPILSVSDIAATITSCSAPVVAVSPIIGGKAIKGPTAKLMRESGIEPTALSIAEHYRVILDGLIIDDQDAAYKDAIEAMGITVEVTNTIMLTLQDKQQLATTALELAARLRADGAA
jgi:LPPG:FO 2-phospho-L-lactate transferase